jgi:hypothetical protein
MTTFQALALGIMVVWTPSLIIIAYFLWRSSLIEQKSKQLSAQELSTDHIDRPRLLRSTKAGVPNLYVEDTGLQPNGDEQIIVTPQDASRDRHEA